jgi:DNA-binding SARP family transcriptional activator
MRWRILGPVEVTVPGRVLLDRRPQQRGLLAYLLLNANRPVSTEQLLEALWGATAPPTARTQVHANVSRIRRALREHDLHDVLTSRAGAYRLAVECGELDLAEFVRQVEAARAAVSIANLPGAAELLRDALGIWQGAALSGAAGAFVEAAAVRLQEQRLLAWEELAAIELSRGRHAQLADELPALVEDNPLRERLVGQLMLALAAGGQQAQALGLYAKTRYRLADELGVEPSRELAAAHLRILRQQVPVTAAAHAPTAPAAPAAPAPLPAQIPPAQLPADLPVFAGRTLALRHLGALLPGESPSLPGESPRGPLAVAITGTAGVGKTTLAVRWAHRIAHQFPDGQLYVNLRGFDPVRPARSPAEALRGLLGALGVPAPQIPANLDGRAGLYRSMLAGRRVLLLLDSARDPDQVRTLLPGAPGCLTVITSRNQLTSLIATDAVQPLTLDLLSHEEARQLLTRRLGTDRIASEPQAADRIIALCARLPLALSFAAARIATRPTFPIGTLAQELGAVHTRLDALSSHDPRADIRAVFSGSYRALSPAAARVFRLLGLHPGPDLTLPAAASLAGQPTRQVRPQLVELTQAHLVSEHIPGRYTTHDLLRAYAIELARRLDPDAGRRAAVHRMLDHYLHTAALAGRLSHPPREQIAVPAALPGVTVADLADRQQALAWLAEERPVLLAVVQLAADSGRFPLHALQLAGTLGCRGPKGR